MKQANEAGYREAANYVYRSTFGGKPYEGPLSSLGRKFGISANVSQAFLKNDVLLRSNDANGNPIFKWNKKYGIKDIRANIEKWTKEHTHSMENAAAEKAMSNVVEKKAHKPYTRKVVVQVSKSNTQSKSAPTTSLSGLSLAKTNALKATANYIDALQKEANYIKSLLEN